MPTVYSMPAGSDVLIGRFGMIGFASDTSVESVTPAVFPAADAGVVVDDWTCRSRREQVADCVDCVHAGGVVGGVERAGVK